MKSEPSRSQLSLGDVLESGLSTSAGRGVTFDGGTFQSWVELHDAARSPQGFVDGHETVGVLAENSSECVAAMLGIWQAGKRLVSLPAPPRGSALDEYSANIAAICQEAGMSLVLTSSAVASALRLPCRVATFTDAARHRRSATETKLDTASLTQFTSGSTSFPRGVELSSTEVAANVAAITGTYNFTSTTGGVSWLPLSHDMGLIGGLLASFAAGYSLRLSSPERFMRSPASWVADVAQHQPEAAVLPNFALPLIARHAAKFAPGDLNSLRYCILGGDPVSARSLRAFAEVTGIGPDVLKPAYGMAEATLAVTLTGGLWRSVLANAESFAAGHLEIAGFADASSDPATFPENTLEVAASGFPVPGGVVTAPADGSSARITVSTPSVSQQLRSSAGSLQTADIGWMTESGVVVAGRADDVIISRGRKIYPTDVERAVHAVDGVRAGNVAALGMATGSETSILIVAEPAQAPTLDLCLDVRDAVSRQCRVAPASVVFVERGSLLKTTSGKVRRGAVEAALQSEKLPVLLRWDRRSRATPQSRSDQTR